MRNNDKTVDYNIDMFHLGKTELCVIGFKESFVIYFINYKHPKYLIDGDFWCRLSLKDFSEGLPFMSPSTIRKILKDLKEKDLIIAKNYNKNKYDRTLCYVVNNEKVFHLISEAFDRDEEGTI